MRLAGRSSTVGTRAAFIAIVVALSVGATGCKPEPTPSGATASASGVPSAPTSPSANTALPSEMPNALPSESPTETTAPQPDTDIALPAACENIYSEAMLTSLNEKNPPLNHPGVSMTSTQNVEALELLNSGLETLRCSWGTPSESGLATNISLVTAEQSAALLGALPNSGFACDSRDDVTVCRYEQTLLDYNDDIVYILETHAFRGNMWVSTNSLNFAPDGYLDDIVATLWG